MVMIPVPISCFFPLRNIWNKAGEVLYTVLGTEQVVLILYGHGKISSPAFSVYPYDSKYVD